ncbi:hypothetical protein [Methylobacterium frigidaeris]|uniref:hypothetical protein n=1 Tax=Methylobacterium frigidaeris TaxID=2038277 RepID=UPI001EDD8B62|nr:hypothetical protein [Methylobacterium frigidaeris]
MASTEKPSGSFLGTMATASGVAFKLSKSLGGMAVDAAYAIGGELVRNAGAELVDRGWFGRDVEQPALVV